MVVTSQPRHKEHWCPIGKTETRQDYYMVREVPVCTEDYWEPKADPDGFVRNRDTESERLQFIVDQRYLIDGVNALSPDNVLDFGAGLGWLLSEIQAENKFAIEASKMARTVLDSQGVWVMGSSVVLARDSMDVVICHHVIEHLYDPLSAITEFRRLLRRGGTLVLATPDFGSPCAVRFGERYRMLHDQTHRSLFTLESCHRMLRDYGFMVERVDYPFPERYANAETMERWIDTSKVSPPWPGNWMTLWAVK